GNVAACRQADWAITLDAHAAIAVEADLYRGAFVV
nr:hypothetical protein [Tanacetum cinerariifolium]